MKNNAWLGVIAAISLATMAAPAAGAEAGFYAGIGIAQTEWHMGESDGMVIAISGPFGGGVFQQYPDNVEADDGALGWQATIGYRINRYVAAEVAYVSFGEADVLETYIFEVPPVPFFPTELTRDYSATVAGPTLSVLGSLPVGANFGLFLRGGMLFADQEVQLKFTNGSQSMTFGEEVWFGGAGIDCTLAGRWIVRAEYQRTAKLAATLTSAATELENLSLSVLFRL
jgi:Outer membrane protein beta-barrel domain